MMAKRVQVGIGVSLTVLIYIGEVPGLLLRSVRGVWG